MKKLESLTSTDIVAQNIETLKQLFPTIVKEGRIDEIELKAILGEYIEDEDECYRFTWAGKSEARAEANKPSTATLRPDRESSKDWDSTENIFIEGDNLEVLKLLQKSYSNKIKMIYIDPPYNTGKDFVYKDNYKDNLANYLEQTGQLDEEGRKTSTNSESDGRYHSNWLNMMYPRLQLARNLMSEDGVIFISIDDNEQANLKKLCDEVFGEENVECYVWDVREYGAMPKTASNTVRGEHEYFIAAYKEQKKLDKYTSYKYLDLKNWRNVDGDPRGNWMSANISRGSGKSTGGSNSYIITNPFGVKFDRDWSISQEEYKSLLADNRIYFANEGQGVPRKKIFQNESVESIQSSLFEQLKSSQNASGKLKNIFGFKVFDYPKPVELIERCVQISSSNDSMILDFFAGSGTTAHAVMQLNAEDGGTRKCISVQLPEPTDEKSEVYKAGYSVISDITKERIRRAGEKIKADNKDKEGIDKLDVGFKAFKLDSSNIRAWDSSKDALETQLDLFVENNGENIKADRSEEDVLFEVLLKYGIDLSTKIEQKEIAGTTVYNIGYGSLFVCLSDSITTAVAEAIGQWKEELEPETCRVIFKDTGFGSDADKTNSMQILKRFEINDVASL